MKLGLFLDYAQPALMTAAADAGTDAPEVVHKEVKSK